MLIFLLISDLSFVCYLPSVLGTTTMLHVIEEIEPVNPMNYQNLLLSVLKINEVYIYLSSFHCFVLTICLLVV